MAASKTATDITIEHYRRPEVKAAIIGYCTSNGGMRALNASERWYKGGKDPKTVMLRGPADYADTIEMGRPLYATLDILDPSVFEQAILWDDKRRAPVRPIGDLSNCLAFTLSTDIDSTGDIKSLSIKEAVEAAAQFHVDYLRKRGIEKSVYCLYSGGGIYVHLHHGLFAVDTGNTELTPEDRRKEFQILTRAYNRLIEDISKAFFRKYPQHIGQVKFDQLNNQKRTFKVIFSLHKRYPYAVVPLDPKSIKIDFKRASLPLSGEVLAEGGKWYQSFDPSEKKAIVALLKEKIEEIKKIINKAPTGNSTISRLPEPLDQASFAPCMKNIIANAQPVEGRHRALGILATYLYQVGWSKDQAFKLWAGIADRCQVETRIFESEFGRLSCPFCDTIQQNSGGYPHLNLYNLGFCVPDAHCKGCQWPGDYSSQQILNEMQEAEPLDIVITHRHFQDLTALTMPELVKRNDPPHIFVRSGNLVRIRKDEYGIMQIELLTEASLLGEVGRCAHYLKETKSKGLVDSNPPPNLIKDILNLTAWPEFPPLRALIASPVIRPDGTVLTTPGYDSATGLYYTGSMEMALQVTESPTHDEAVKAADYLREELLGDFPFKDDASRANALGALLTPITMPLINGNVPLGLFDKPQAGTGASLLTEIIAEITTGNAASMQTAPGTDEEWRKAITAVLTQGPQIVVIDNVTNILRSAKLSQMLTARTWSDRMLGKTKMLSLPQTAAWFATGNNIQLGGDLARRSYWIRLDAEMPRPWLRVGFRHADIKAWTRNNREMLLSKLITMVRAWVVAGQPGSKDLLKIGSFESWSRVIGGILTFAGVKGFLGNGAELYDSADQEISQWDLFLEQWQLLHRDDKITAAQLKTELTDFQSIYKPFQNEMPEEVIKATDKTTRGAVALGHTLRRHSDHVFPSGRKLTSTQDSHTKGMKWGVTTIQPFAEV